MSRISLSITLLLLVTSSGYGDVILDQANNTNVFRRFNGDNTITWQQEVIAGVTGRLEQVNFFAQIWEDNGDPLGIDFFVNVGSPWQSDTAEFSSSLNLNGLGLNTSTNTTVSVDVSSANIFLNAGDSLVLGFSGTDGDVAIIGNHTTETQPNGYYAGELFLNSNAFDDGRWDLGFETFMNPVPEPSAMLLFTAAGLFTFSRRRRRDFSGLGF